VTARATANDGTGVYGELTITITNQFIPVTGITVTGTQTISTDNGTTQLTATVVPANATTKSVTWSIISGTTLATISNTGLVTALDNGTIVARATSTDGTNVYGELTITITNQVIPVTGITVTGTQTISTDNGTTQLTAAVLPSNATTKSVTWSISSGTTLATISNTGLVTALDNGTVTARATANDGTGVYGELTITITNQFIPVTGITVTGTQTISADNGTTQLTATVVPTNATTKSVTWSITSGTTLATISNTGLVTALDNGNVTARATANDGTGVYGELTITITNQFIPVTSINVSGEGGATTISTDDGTLQLTATVLPANASIKTVTWWISEGTGQASLSPSGLLTAIADGTVMIRASANDGTMIYGELEITITGQNTIPVQSITIYGEGGSLSITIDDGTLQLYASVSPFNASNKSVTWSLFNGVGHAEITPEGLITAHSNGRVTVRATANDGSRVYGQAEIDISNQIVPVNKITVSSADGSSLINQKKGTKQLLATVLPEEATEKSVTWSVLNISGEADIDRNGLVTAERTGTIIAVARANDGSEITGSMEIEIDTEVPIIIINKYEMIVTVPRKFLRSHISLLRLDGLLIETRKLYDTECRFDVSALPPGIYLISIHNSVILYGTKVLKPF
jgi:uncharacterized protein YjdB